MKKVLVLLISAIIITSMLLGGCTQSQKPAVPETKQNEGGSSQVAPAPKPAEKIKIEFWHSLGGANGELVKNMAADFNGMQQEVEVAESFQGNYNDCAAKIMTSVAAGTPPASSMIERAFVTSFVPDGVLEDLKPYADRDKFDLDDFFIGLMAFSNYGDKVYSFPCNRSTPLMFYNKTKFKEMGFNPDGPQTWDDLRKYAKELSTPGKPAFSCVLSDWFMEAYLYQTGGSIYNADYTGIGFNNESGHTSYDFWRDMLKEGLMKLPTTADVTQGSDEWAVVRNDFIEKNTYITLDSTGIVASLFTRSAESGFELGACFLPANKNFGTPTGGGNMSIIASASADQKEAAWKFFKWMKEPVQDARFAKGTGYVTTRKSTSELKEMQDYFIERPQFKVAVEQLTYAKDTATHVKWPETQKIIQKYLQMSMLEPEKITTKEALAKMDEEVKKLLSK